MTHNRSRRQLNCQRAAILVLVGRYGLSSSWRDLFRPSPQHGAAMDGRNKSGHDDVATGWTKMRIADGKVVGNGGMRCGGVSGCRLDWRGWKRGLRQPGSRDDLVRQMEARPAASATTAGENRH